KATVKPESLSNKSVTWSSSNTKVATVDKDGIVIGKSNGTTQITAKTSNGKTDTCKVTVKEGYWEVKKGKYIYHYLNGTSKEWTISEYTAWNKLKEQKVKALSPTAYKRNGNMFTYAGITHQWFVQDSTADNIAIKNGGSPYAITVDHDRARESIFKINNGIWEPIKSIKVLIGRKGLSYNLNGQTDPKIYTKNTHTPIGLYYIDGYRSNNNNLYWVEFGVIYSDGKNGHGWNNGDYLHAGDNPVSWGGNSGGCIVADLEYAKWIYFNCGRGTPVLIW
ncbi:MAG: Ig-like domain-containing protein, partial [Clostridia bacterium]|nr:Ig-like domain-containing protein [Clostridia bacterium]